MKVFISLFMMAVALITVPQSQASSEPYIKQALVETCTAVKSNNPLKLKQELREYRLDVDTIREKLVCNGLSVHQFALAHKANRTANMINKGSVNITDIPVVK